MNGVISIAAAVCGRQRYGSRLEARIALARLARKHPDRKERASQWCPFCCGWHLTRRPQRRKTAWRWS